MDYAELHSTASGLFEGQLVNPSDIVGKPPASAVLTISAKVKQGHGTWSGKIGWTVCVGQDVLIKLPPAPVALGQPVPVPAAVARAWKTAKGEANAHCMVHIGRKAGEPVVFALHAKALNGEDLVDDCLALSEMRELKSFLTFPRPSGLRATMAADAPDKSTDIVDLLGDIPDAPAATGIIEVPAVPVSQDATLIDYAMTIESYVSFITALHMNKEHPTKYDITNPDDRRAFAADLANWKLYVLQGKSVKCIPAILPLSEITSFCEPFDTTMENLHMEILTKLFAGLNLTKEIVDQLDAILTAMTPKLADIVPDSSMDQTVSYYTIATAPGTGVDGVPRVPIIKFKLLWVRIDRGSWSQITKNAGKHTPEERQLRITLKAQFFKSECTMSTPTAKDYIPKMKEQMLKATKKDYKEISKLIGTKGIKEQKQQ